jgi:arginine exporter protein ArgO
MLAVFGFTAISGLMKNYSQEIQFIGGGLIIVFGLKLFITKPKLSLRTHRTSWAELRRLVDWVPERLRPALRFQIWRILPHTRIIPQTFFITVTNPVGVLAILGIIAWLISIIGGVSNYIQALVLVASVMAGSLFWWAVVARVIEKLRDKITENRLRRINQVAGVVLLAFGGLLFVKLAVGVTGNAADVTGPGLGKMKLGLQIRSLQ